MIIVIYRFRLSRSVFEGQLRLRVTVRMIETVNGYEDNEESREMEKCCYKPVSRLLMRNSEGSVVFGVARTVRTVKKAFILL